MKEPDWKTCSELELWQYVAWHLAEVGIDSVLVGGAVAAIYSNGIYRSGDLDFVSYEESSSALRTVLRQLGFAVKGRHFVHSRCKHLFLDFVSPPLGIGDDVNIKPVTRRVSGREIKLLSPTDCIRDRLASYIHFKSRDCLDQAVLVARRQPFQMRKVQAWCLAEGGGAQYQEFIRLVGRKKSN